MNEYFSTKNNNQILDRILNNGIQNNEEKQFYLSYLQEKSNKLISKNKEDNKNNFKNIFKDFWHYYKNFHRGTTFAKDLIIYIYYFFIIGILFLSPIVELGIFKTLSNLYGLKVCLGMIFIPVIKSFVPGLIHYLSNKKRIKLDFNKNKTALKEEIEYVNNLYFEKEKQQTNDNYYEERYLLGDKEKTNIYKRIADIVLKLKDIDNIQDCQQLIVKVDNILLKFDETRMKLENINPSEAHLIIQDKISIYSKISFELDEVEQELERLLNKQERIKEDNRQIQELNNKLKKLTR